MTATDWVGVTETPQLRLGFVRYSSTLIDYLYVSYNLSDPHTFVEGTVLRVCRALPIAPG